MRKVGVSALPQYSVLVGGGTSDQVRHFGKVVAKIPARRITEAAGRLIDLYREQRQSETGRPRSVLPAHRPVGSRRAAEGPRRARTRTRPLQTTSSTSAKARRSIRSLWMGSALHKSQILKSQIPSQDVQRRNQQMLGFGGLGVGTSASPSGGGAPWPTADEVRCRQLKKDKTCSARDAG